MPYAVKEFLENCAAEEWVYLALLVSILDWLGI